MSFCLVIDWVVGLIGSAGLRHLFGDMNTGLSISCSLREIAEKCINVGNVPVRLGLEEAW